MHAETYMIMPCVSKPCCTHGIIVSLWLKCYIQFAVWAQYLLSIHSWDSSP